MKKLLFLTTTISLLLISCATTRKEGCDYGAPKKSHNGVPRGFLSVSYSPQQRTPKNIQVKVVEILERGKYRGMPFVHCRTVTMQGKTIDVKYYFGGLFPSTKKIQVGTKLTLHGWEEEEMECGKWQVGKIQINN